MNSNMSNCFFILICYNLEQILVRKPIGIYFANTTAVCDVDADLKARNCVIPLLMKVSLSLISSFNTKTPSVAL